MPAYPMIRPPDVRRRPRPSSQEVALGAALRTAEGGRHAERLQAQRDAAAAVRPAASPGETGWLAPVVPEVVATSTLRAPELIFAPPASGRPIVGEHLDDGPGTPARRTMRPRQLAITGLVALVAGLLLNAGALERSAQTSPYGKGRTVALDVLHPLATIAHYSGLDLPRAGLDSMFGRGDTGSASVAADSVPPPDAPTGQLGALGAVRAAGAAPGGAPAASGTAAGQLPTGPGGTSGGAPAPQHFQTVTVGRVPSLADPLRVWVGGDSVSGYLGLGMVDLAGKRGDLAVHSHYQTSTGLSRPDYYDWPAHLEEDMQRYDPETVVLLVGANDDQPVTTADGSIADFASPAWTAEYGRRVGTVMDRLIGEHRMVVWVGLPVMRSADFDQRMQVMNSVYRAQAALRPGVVFVDSRPIMADGGGYTAYLNDGSGHQVLMRAADGIHLSPDGGRRLAGAVADVILQTLRANDAELPTNGGHG